ncbi:MAG: ABC-type transport auxiliary lipoprotein family protein [Parvularcula sp.]|jgi:ABC-type uncharacterized transport system auxiliary subunit|nr:ABC-type transport auxiliary lipoprotein family protein [Parvularcula sp.]
MTRAVLILLALTLTGCVSLIQPASTLPPRYTMNALDRPAAEGADLPVTLAISDARSEAALNTSRIAVKTAPNEIRYVKGGEWSDRAPRIFSLLVERSFEERGRLLAVSDRVALPVADYIFFADIQDLNVDRSDGSDIAIVSFRARLEDRRGRVLEAKRFRAEVSVTDHSTRAAAMAINEAAATVTAEAADWAIALIEERQNQTDG